MASSPATLRSAAPTDNVNPHIQIKKQNKSTFPRPEQHLSSLNVLSWPCKFPFTSVDVETSLLPILLKWGKNERGMMKDQPKFRLHQIKTACRKVNVPISQALSLRRHHIRNLNPYQSMEQLRLGRMGDIRKSADLFEASAEQYLRYCKIPIITEGMQKEQHFRRNSEAQKNGFPAKLLPPTPDFLLETPIRIKIDGTSPVSGEFVVHWIEVKHFYGASSIPHDNKSAVGCILRKSRMYRDQYGPGAIVFAYGAGAELTSTLTQMGVVVLDSGPLRMDAVVRQLRSWCADEYGKILP
jgi:hypothetical protein